MGGGSPHGDEKDKKKHYGGPRGAKPPEENSCRAFRSTNLPQICTHVRFGVHAVTPLEANGKRVLMCLFNDTVYVEFRVCFAMAKYENDMFLLL